ncbi:MAG TPA: type II toxin-antitoxin system PemK/MazF family toxin [Acidisphaera sp.]|nr:type II toxin-antitoxin system PemK/MazF family toxin [Acidisphaera sp.]
MRRGDVVIVADRSGDFTSKPRPAVIIQSDSFQPVDGVTVCPITSVETDASMLRISIAPSEELPLDRPSWIVVNKITTVLLRRISQPIGRLSADELARTTSAVALFLGIA